MWMKVTSVEECGLASRGRRSPEWVHHYLGAPRNVWQVMKLADVKLEGDSHLSLSKLCGGRTIADIHCRISNEFGDPIIKLWAIVFTDGSKLYCEGEHDIAYVTEYGDGKVLPDQDTLTAIEEEEE